MDEHNQETIKHEKEPVSVFGMISTNLLLKQEPCEGLKRIHASILKHIISFTQKINLSLSPSGKCHALECDGSYRQFNQPST